MSKNAEIRQQIETSANAARAEGQYVDYDLRLPTLLIYRGPDDEFYFQESQAEEPIEAARKIASETGADFDDVLLWQAQSW